MFTRAKQRTNQRKNIKKALLLSLPIFSHFKKIFVINNISLRYRTHKHPNPLPHSSIALGTGLGQAQTGSSGCVPALPQWVAGTSHTLRLHHRPPGYQQWAGSANEPGFKARYLIWDIVTTTTSISYRHRVILKFLTAQMNKDLTKELENLASGKVLPFLNKNAMYSKQTWDLLFLTSKHFEKSKDR